MVDAVKGYMVRCLAPITAGMEELRCQLEAMPTPKDGKDGKDVDLEDVRPLVETEVAKAVLAIPPIPGEKGEKGKDGTDGIAGEPGRDALDITVLESIDEAKIYPRGTFALYKGGMIRAFRKTDPITESLDAAGWKTCCNGLAEESYEIIDDGRLVRRTASYTNGQKSVTELKTAAMIYREIWSPDKDYDRGDSVTRSGQVYVCKKSGTKQVPGAPGADEWRLAIKAGRDGKPGEPGKQGPEGKRGKDWNS